MFLDMPRDRYTLKVKTIVVEPPPEHPNAVKDYYGQWVMIPNGAANMEEYAKAVADALNIVQIYGQALEICTEKTDEDFFGSDTVPENQYQLPAAADVDGSGKVTQDDITMLLKRIAKKI